MLLSSQQFVPFAPATKIQLEQPIDGVHIAQHALCVAAWVPSGNFVQRTPPCSAPASLTNLEHDDAADDVLLAAAVDAARLSASASARWRHIGVQECLVCKVLRRAAAPLLLPRHAPLTCPQQAAATPAFINVFLNPAARFTVEKKRSSTRS